MDPDNASLKEKSRRQADMLKTAQRGMGRLYPALV